MKFNCSVGQAGCNGTFNSNYEEARRAISQARDSGWVWDEGLAICPNCSKGHLNGKFMLSAYQEPKYKIQVEINGKMCSEDEASGRLVNRQSGVPIPEDEPILILRARDVFAAPTLKDYARKLPSGPHKEAVLVRAAQFENWAAQHSDRMKTPDTQIDEGWTTAGTPPEEAS